MQNVDLRKRRGAILSECGLYRYSLWEKWKVGPETSAKGMVLFVLLNPSTADASRNDPTFVRCREFAKAWGYSGFFKANLFAYRATDPRQMKIANDPVGGLCDVYLKKMAVTSSLIVVGWGRHGFFRGRDAEVLNLLAEFGTVHSLKTNKDGSPSHPLYLPKTLKPVVYKV